MSSPDRRSSAFAAGSVPENYDRRLAPTVFEPWAEVLLEAVGVRPGSHVLDLATGTGVVARLAARHAGRDGRVVAADVSAPMLAHAATRPAPADAAPIEFLEAPASDLTVPDDSFDVVLCQQGLPFFTDRPGAAAEIRRVLRDGGVAGVSVWVAGRPAVPFDAYIDALAATGVEPPFPRAFDAASFKMSADDVRSLLAGAGFSAVDVSVLELTITFDDVEAAAGGILGTPFAPLVQGLPPDRREAFDAELQSRFRAEPGGPVRLVSTSVIGRAA